MPVRGHCRTLAQPAALSCEAHSGFRLALGRMAVPEPFRGPIGDIVAELVGGNFAALDPDGRSGRVGSDGLRRAVIEYGRTLLPLPEDAFELGDAGQVAGRLGDWWIVVPMWTAEEGRSDLSLELSAVSTANGHRFEVTDLHVL